jgi:serine/threonine-protein phosphatase 2A activator
MLDDISGVRTWAKVNEGMMKMYRAEVLLKLPIAQHIFFGSILTFPQAAEEEGQEAQEDEHGHIHAHGKSQEVGWGDCCGIPIPSAFAAAQEERAKQQGLGESIRRIPFD